MFGGYLTLMTPSMGLYTCELQGGRYEYCHPFTFTIILYYLYVTRLTLAWIHLRPDVLCESFSDGLVR